MESNTKVVDISWNKFFPEVSMIFRNKSYKIVFCHALPERSFFIGKYQLPICSRCTGIFLGILISLILMNYVNIPIWLSLLFVSPLIIDGFLQLFNVRISNNLMRLFTGLLFGLALL